MPTNWKRIAVTEDPALEEALAAVAQHYPGYAAGRLVHDLAIIGAKRVVEQQAVNGDRLEALVAFSTQRDDLIDWDVLERAQELAWGE